MKKKLKIGITGGIGSGKSTAAKVFAAKGYDVIIADDISKDLLAKDLKIIKKIKSAFGEKAYKNGAPDKKFLADNVFADPQKLAKINSIIHPPTLEKQKNLMAESLQKNKVVFVESALIFEAELESLFDYILLVTATVENKIERVMARNKFTREEVLQRIENQIPDEEKRGASDFVIENDSGIDELEKKSAFILMLLENMTV